jgi:hypothetical protein
MIKAKPQGNEPAAPAGWGDAKTALASIDFKTGMKVQGRHDCKSRPTPSRLWFAKLPNGR